MLIITKMCFQHGSLAWNLGYFFLKNGMVKNDRVISHFFVIELGIAAIITGIAVRGLAVLMVLFIFMALLLGFAYFVTSGKAKELNVSARTTNTIERVYSIVSKYNRMIFPYTAILSSTFTVFAFTYGVAFILLLEKY